MTAPTYLKTTDGREIAYSRSAAAGEGANLPGLVFLGGFRSDMTGTKAMFLEAHARATGRAFLRFDYTGHGASSGDFLDGGIASWARDAETALTELTEGPQILIGSSMGGWMSLLMAKRLPGRVAGIVGIAAAPDFTEDSMWAGFSEAQRATLMSDGQVALPSEYSDEPYIITRRLIEEGRESLVLRDPLPLSGPVRLLHGSADVDVPLEVPMRLISHADCADMRLLVVKGSDHRFSSEADLELIRAAVEEVTARAVA